MSDRDRLRRELRAGYDKRAWDEAEADINEQQRYDAMIARAIREVAAGFPRLDSQVGRFVRSCYARGLAEHRAGAHPDYARGIRWNTRP